MPFGRQAGMGGAGRGAGMMPFTQPQRMAFDTSGAQNGGSMGNAMLNAQQKNPWVTQQQNLGMMGPQQGYGQRYRGLGPSEEAMQSWQAQSAGKQMPRMGMYGIPGGGGARGGGMMPHQEEVGRPDMNLMAARGIAPTSPYDQMMMSSRSRPSSYMYS